MANYATLKAAIAATIKENGNNEITGALLQQAILSMIDSLGAGYQFMNVAYPTDTPGTPDQRSFFIAAYPGTYANFGGITVGVTEIAILVYDSAWHKLSVRVPNRFALDCIILGKKTVGPQYFVFDGFYTYGADTQNRNVRFADGTYNGICVYLPAGKLSVSFVSKNGFIWAVAYSSPVYYGTTGGQLMTQTTVNGKLTFSVSENENGLWVLVTIQESVLSAGNIEMYNGIGDELDGYVKMETFNSFYEQDLVGKSGNQYNGYSLANMFVSGDAVNNEIRSSTSQYNSVIVKVPAGISQISCKHISGFIPYAHAYNEMPVIGTTGGELCAITAENNVAIYTFSPSVSERFILFTLNLSVGSLDDFLMFPFPYAQNLILDSIKKPIRLIRNNSAEILSMTETGYIQADGTVAENNKWKNGYIDLTGCKAVVVNHIANDNPYTSTYVFLCDSSKNPLVGYQIAFGKQEIDVSDDAKYLFLAVEYPVGNNQFYCELYANNEIIRLQNQISKNASDISENASDISEIYDLIQRDALLIVPNDLYAVKGKQLSIYYDALIKDFDRGLQSPANYYVDIECPTLHAISGYVGVRRERMWQLYARPESQYRSYNIVGDHTLYFKVYNKLGDIVAQKNCTLHIIDNVGLSSAKNIICIGDSLTNNGPIVKTMADDFIAAGGTQPTFIGTRSTDGYNHEGWPGYTFQMFVSNPGNKIFVFQVPLTANLAVHDYYYVNGVRYWVVDIRQEYPNTKSVRCDGSAIPPTSGTLVFGSGAPTSDPTIEYSSVDVQGATPFWNENTNQVDIANYRSEMGMGSEKFDLVVIMLGTNDCLYYIRDMATAVNAAKTLINAFISDAGAYPTKIILQLTPADANTISSWQVYPDQANIPEKVAYWFNVWNLRKLLFEEFTKPEYSGKVWIGQAPLGLDRYYGYPYETFISDDRINIQEDYHTNSVHPNVPGYQQLGDQYFLQGLNLLKQ